LEIESKKESKGRSLVRIRPTACDVSLGAIKCNNKRLLRTDQEKKATEDGKLDFAFEELC